MKITKEYWSQFGFGIPHREVFNLLDEYQPIVEVCAGGGMYNAMAQALGIHIVSYDAGYLKTIEPFPGSEVHKMDAEKAVRKHDKSTTIFMSYPPLNSHSVVNALKEMAVGQHLIVTAEYKGATPFWDAVFGDFEIDEWLWLDKTQEHCICVCTKFQM